MNKAHTIFNPQFNNGNSDEFIKNLKINLSESLDGHSVTNFRKGKNSVLYGFKLLKDLNEFSRFLMRHNISFSFHDSEGAIYPYQVILDNKSYNTMTYYTPETITQAITNIKELKTILVKAQDYEKASELHSLERYFVNMESHD